MAVLCSPSLIIRAISVDVKQHFDQRPTELRSCVEVEVAVLCFQSRIIHTISLGVKQHFDQRPTELRSCVEVEVGRPLLPVPNNPYDLCGRKATLRPTTVRAQELCGSRGGRPLLPVPSKPYGLCGRKATMKLNSSRQSSGAVRKSRWPSFASSP